MKVFFESNEIFVSMRSEHLTEGNHKSAALYEALCDLLDRFYIG